ncbi:MAG: ABC transporter permease [Sandaracinaceae bacterium]|nr:ABC transporter permease [Sandaracinaceae bacterium]
MLTVIGRRSLWAIPVLFVIQTSVFLLLNALGDPAVAQLGPRASAAQLQNWRHQHGTDRPLGTRYLEYMGGLVHGDMGVSHQESRRSVTDVLETRLPRTALLGAMAIVIEVVLGLLLGVIAAVRRNTLVDTGVMGVAILGISAPTFVTGLLFLNILAFRFGWFPVGGYGVDAMDHLRHALLPAFTLAITGIATYARVMRAEMLETLRSDYIRTARAKGLSEFRTVVVHAVRNALLPVVTLVGLSLPIIVSGAIISEAIYAWPGLGRLAVESITSRDDPVVMGVVLLSSLGVVIGNLFADIGVAALDPRVRTDG